jgi:osmoprotectant transport system substrate-binding protein
MKRLSPILLLIAMLVSLAGCSTGSNSTAKGPIVVGSKIDTEGSLLSQMFISVLKDKGFTVVDKSQFGTTQVVRKALLAGELDIYPEYTGNGAFFFPNSDQTVWKDATAGYQSVKKLDKDANNITWLTQAPANNTWAIAVPKTLADKERMSSMSDFAAYVNKGGQVKLAGSQEFVTSSVALPAFEKAYGFTLKQDQLVTLASGDTALTEKAAADGTGGVNAAMSYGTDGSLSALGLVVLSDPKGAQPVYEPAPTVRGAVFSKYPELAGILDPIMQSLSLETLQSLNAKIAVQGQNATSVANDYLVSKGFLKK